MMRMKIRKDSKGNVFIGSMRFTKSSWVSIGIMIGVPIYVLLAMWYG